jgi:hypothetical protein
MLTDRMEDEGFGKGIQSARVICSVRSVSHLFMILMFEQSRCSYGNPWKSYPICVWLPVNPNTP